MLRNTVLALGLPLAMLFSVAACEGEATVEFSWSGSVQTEFKGASSGGSTSDKSLEVNIVIDPGNGTVENQSTLKDVITLTQSWQTNLAGQTSDASTQPASYDKDVTYKPNKAVVVAGKINATFVVTLQAGWNKFSAAGTISVSGADSKGNRTTEQRTVTVPDGFVFTAFTAPIPLKVDLKWDKFGADMDLIAVEDGTRYVDWETGMMGYNEFGCNGVATTDRVGCYDTYGYVLGETRTTGYSFGSFDKDSVGTDVENDGRLIGPETYTLDDKDSTKIPSPYVDATTSVDIYVNYYESTQRGTTTDVGSATPKVGVYMNGSDVPRCFRTTAPLTEEKADPPSTNAGNLVHIGQFIYMANGSHTFTEDTATQTAGTSTGIVVEEYTANGSFCD